MSSEMLQAVRGTDATPCAEEHVAASYKLVPRGNINVSLINKQYENGSDRAISSRFHKHKTSLTRRFEEFPITTSADITDL